jgi:TRAP-type mannitol/chloroaromatic compound transport system substrate-binding protein
VLVRQNKIIYKMFNTIKSRISLSKNLNGLSKNFSSTIKRGESKWPLNWEVQSVWPEKLVNNEVLFKFKETIEAISGKRWTITPKFGVNKDVAFDNARAKKTHMILGHSTYWNGVRPAASFFASVPFGMSRSEFLSWVKFGGGKAYWEKLYGPLDLVPVLAGDTGMQMGGWFPKKMNSIEDFRGLKMRIEGLGGPILEKFGLQLVNAPASKLASMLDSGELDACEFATPVMDEAAGLHKTKKKLYFHYPGWHQPSAVFEYLIPKDIYNSLSDEQVAMIDSASINASLHFTLHLQAENELVLEKMMKAGVELHRFPDELILKLRDASRQVLNETMKQDDFSYEVYKSYMGYLERMSLWGPMSGSAIWKWRK